MVVTDRTTEDLHCADDHDALRDARDHWRDDQPARGSEPGKTSGKDKWEQRYVDASRTVNSHGLAVVVRDRVQSGHGG